MKRVSRDGWFWAGTVLALFFLYSPIVHSQFVYDDVWYVVSNPAIRHINPYTFFTDAQTAANPHSGLEGDVYRPLSTLSFAIDYHLWKLWPLPYHLENLSLHLLNGILLALLLQRLGMPAQSIVLGVCVFLFHPVQVQSVAWVSQQSNLIGCMFFLCSLLFLIPLERNERYLEGVVCYGLALLFKETTIVLPLMLGVYWICDASRPPPQLFPRRWAPLILLCGLTLLYVALRFQMLHQWSQWEGAAFPTDQWALGLLAFPVYLGKLIVPIALRPSYGYPDLRPWLVLGGLIFLFFYIGAWKYLRKREPTLALAMAWVLLGLVPVLQIIPIRAFLAERFLYIPMIGVAVGLSAWASRGSGIRKALWLWLGILGIVTWRAVPQWETETSLWAYAVRHEPTNPFAQACLAQSLGDNPEAEAHYFKALVNDPSSGIRQAAYQNLASLHHGWGHAWKARYWKRLAVQGR